MEVRHILEREWRRCIERTGEPADRFVMNRATLKALSKEIDWSFLSPSYNGPDWFYRGIPILVSEDLKDNEIYFIFK